MVDISELCFPVAFHAQHDDFPGRMNPNYPNEGFFCVRVDDV